MNVSERVSRGSFTTVLVGKMEPETSGFLCGIVSSF